MPIFFAKEQMTPSGLTGSLGKDSRPLFRPPFAWLRLACMASVTAANLNAVAKTGFAFCFDPRGETAMAETRKGEVTFKGNPITLVGPKLKPGDKAPDFTAVGAGLAMVSLADTAGKARLFNVVPSLDTPVCNKQTKRFAEELKALGDKVAAYTVSLDLPFAQARFCTEASIENLKNLSDAHNHSFGEHYGVLIKDLPVPLLRVPFSSWIHRIRSVMPRSCPRSPRSPTTSRPWRP